MAKFQPKTFPKHWSQNWVTLEFILKCAGYTLTSTGIEHGYIKNDHVVWFCDDGKVILFKED